MTAGANGIQNSGQADHGGVAGAAAVHGSGDWVGGGDPVRGAGGAVAAGASLHREIEAARALMANMADLLGDDAELAADTIEGQTSLHEALGRAVARVLELNGLMNGVVGMIATLQDRGERLEKQRETLRTMIAVGMEVGQIKRLELPAATISLRAVPPKVEITNEAEIPLAFWKPAEPKLDKKALLDALKDKQAIPGATLSTGGASINIRAN